MPARPSDAHHLLAVAPPDIDIISVNTTPSGCTPAVTDGPFASFNLGQGNFVPKQLIVSQDGSTAYVITSNLSSILVFNIPGQTVIGDFAGRKPDAAERHAHAGRHSALRRRERRNRHVVSTVAGGDIQQISFPPRPVPEFGGTALFLTCNPDLIAVKP